MTYLTIKYIKGNPYLYEVRSEREGDRVRQVFVRYLGRADRQGAVERRVVERKEPVRVEREEVPTPVIKEPEAITPPVEAEITPPTEVTPPVELEPEPMTPEKIREQALKSISRRGVKGDNLLNIEDIIDEVAGKGLELNADGTVTLYHRTTPENAKQIISDNAMYGKEAGLFFGTNPTGQIEGYGEAIVKVRLPLEKLELNDVFANEAHFRLPTRTIGGKIPIGLAEIWQPQEPEPETTTPLVKPPVVEEIPITPKPEMGGKLAPFGDEVGDILAVLNKKKPISIVKPANLSLIDKDFALEKGMQVREIELNEEKFNIVFLRGNELIADELESTLRNATPADYETTQFHQKLGGILGYSDKDIDFFIGKFEPQPITPKPETAKQETGNLLAKNVERKISPHTGEETDYITEYRLVKAPENAGAEWMGNEWGIERILTVGGEERSRDLLETGSTPEQTVKLLPWESSYKSAEKYGIAKKIYDKKMSERKTEEDKKEQERQTELADSARFQDIYKPLRSSKGVKPTTIQMSQFVIDKPNIKVSKEGYDIGNGIGIVIHGEGKYKTYTVTHLNSGLAMGHDWKDRLKAIALAKAEAQIDDWSKYQTEKDVPKETMDTAAALVRAFTSETMGTELASKLS